MHYHFEPVEGDKLSLIYRLSVVAKQHQAILGDDPGSAGSGDLQRLTFSSGAVVQHAGAIEGHFLHARKCMSARARFVFSLQLE